MALNIYGCAELCFPKTLQIWFEEAHPNVFSGNDDQESVMVFQSVKFLTCHTLHFRLTLLFLIV